MVFCRVGDSKLANDSSYSLLSLMHTHIHSLLKSSLVLPALY